MHHTQITNDDVDWGNILLSADIDVPHGRSEFSIPCPFHLVNSPSCSINIDKGVWICFAGCGQGSLKNLVQRKLGLSKTELAKLFEETEYSLNLDFFEEYQPTDDYMAEVSLPEDFIFEQYPDWIFKRGFTKETLKAWECGTNNYGDLIIPIRDKDSRLVGWVSRRRAAVPKYLYSVGLKKSKLLFGGHSIEPTDFVCVTEGTLDTMWLRQNGYPSVALLGMHLSNKQKDLLAKLRTQEVVLCLDNDEAGKTGLDKALQSIGNTLMVSYIELSDDYKDVQEIQNKKVLDKVINKRYYW